MRAIVTICCAALFVGCIRKSKIDTPVIELDLPDTLLTQQPNFDYIMIKKLVSDLNLPKLETGVDSMEIRIFEEYALSTPDRLITIKFENNSWVFVETKFWTSYPELKNTELVSLIDLCEKVSVDSSITYKITPNVLSTELMGVLRKYQFFEIPSQKEVPGFKNKVDDGVTYYFEVATRKKYRFIVYHCPNMYDDYYNNAVTQVLKFVDKHIIFVELCR